MARKRASMREGPLAELFRATEAAQRQAEPGGSEPASFVQDETVEHAPPFEVIDGASDFFFELLGAQRCGRRAGRLELELGMSAAELSRLAVGAPPDVADVGLAQVGACRPVVAGRNVAGLGRGVRAA